ncbi:MAG: alpha-amylase family protein [Pseudoclavibacter sp.]
MTQTMPLTSETSTLWWKRPFRMLQTNLREIDGGMDVERALDDIQAHGANAWLVNGGGILSFYPSDLEFQTRNPHLRERESGDLLGDALVAARRRGVRVLARMDFSKVAADIAARHPDWLFSAADGRRQEYQGQVSVCPSGPYYQEKVFEILTELCTRYPVDGFFFNWMSFNEMDYSYRDWGACQCGACQDRFAEFSGGLALPKSSDDASHATWKRYAAWTLDDLTARFRAHIASLLPEAALILGERADVLFHEANAKVGRDFWPFTTEQSVSVSKSRRPEVPVLVNSAVFLDMPYRYAPIQDEHFSMYFVQTIARGGIPSTYTMGPPADAPFADLPAGGVITRFHRDNEDSYADLVPAAKVLVVFDDDGGHASVFAETTDLELRGIYEVLQRDHLPFDVGGAKDLALHAAADREVPYSVIVLADVGSLSDEAASALDSWVERGGRLICTGSSGIDGTKVQLATSPAIRRTAHHTDPETLKNTYIADATPGVGDGYNRRSSVWGAYHYLDIKPGTDERHTLLAQVPFGPPEKCYGTRPTQYPGIAIRSAGAGAHAVVPWLPGSTYRHLGTPESGRLLAGLVRELLGSDSELDADLPEQVEVTLQRSPRGLLIHVMNFSGVQLNSIGKPVPVRGGKLRLRGQGFADARALVAGSALEVVKIDGGVSISLPELGLFEVVEVDADG